jgi:hypothetical protein
VQEQGHLHLKEETSMANTKTASQTQQQPKAETPNRKPVHELRVGRLNAAIWENPTENEVRYNVTFARLYKADTGWHSNDSFGVDDLLGLAKLADQTHSWILQKQQEPEQPALISNSFIPPGYPSGEHFRRLISRVECGALWKLDDRSRKARGEANAIDFRARAIASARDQRFGEGICGFRQPSLTGWRTCDAYGRIEVQGTRQGSVV